MSEEIISASFQDNYLFVVTDIHGSLVDFIFYLNLWLRDTRNHIIFTGDLIHGDDFESDGSLDILDMVRDYIEYPTFHVLMGNHEWSQLYDDEVYRFDVNQCESFKLLVKDRFPDEYHERYKDYLNLMKEFDIFLRTDNGLLIIHSGFHEYYLEPLTSDSVNIYKIDDYDDINTFERRILTEHLWCRPYDDYNEDTIQEILNHYNSKFMISGHTNYNGCHIIGNQLIFDSSHNTDTKYYLKVNLNKEYSNIIEVLKDLIKC